MTLNEVYLLLRPPLRPLRPPPLRPRLLRAGLDRLLTGLACLTARFALRLARILLIRRLIFMAFLLLPIALAFLRLSLRR